MQFVIAAEEGLLTGAAALLDELHRNLFDNGNNILFSQMESGAFAGVHASISILKALTTLLLPSSEELGVLTDIAS